MALDSEITLAITGVASFGTNDGRVGLLVVVEECVTGAMEIGTVEPR